MTANLKTLELIQAAIDRINAAVLAAELSFTPVLVQEGDLAFYAANPIPANDLPAVLVKASSIGIEIGQGELADVGGDLVGTRTTLRLVLVDTWENGQQVVARKIQRTQELAQAFVRGSGQPYTMGASVPGYVIVHALPVAIELDPDEDALVSQQQEQQVYATAITLEVLGRSSRV
ncbi:MAG: hypothetical protein IT458_05040 [Planctomycetes bacterium]|nr:hypothetical protein [Planctomycetota bacterium]